MRDATDFPGCRESGAHNLPVIDRQVFEFVHRKAALAVPAGRAAVCQDRKCTLDMHFGYSIHSPVARTPAARARPFVGPL